MSYGGGGSDENPEEDGEDNSEMEFIDFALPKDDLVDDKSSIQIMAESPLNEDDLRAPTTNGVHSSNILPTAEVYAPPPPPPTSHNDESAGKTSAGSGKLKADDEFDKFAIFMASELRLIADIEVARRIKRKMLIHFANCLGESDK